MNLIIDTDVGLDDILCIAKLLQLQKKGVCNILGFTVVSGNLPADKGYQVLKFVLERIFEVDLPVHRGGASTEKKISYYYAKDGHYDLLEESINATYPINPVAAVDFLRNTIDKHTTLLSLGPSSNLSDGEREEPGLLACSRQLVMMAGALDTAGNVQGDAEFNVVFDAGAFRHVISSSPNVLLFPLDITLQTYFRKKELLPLIPPQHQTLFDCIVDKHELHNRMTGQGPADKVDQIVVHDLLLALYCEDQRRFNITDAAIDVDEHGKITWDGKHKVGIAHA